MSPDLTTTNVLLGILAAVSVLEAIAVLGVFLGAAFVYRRLMRTIDGIETRHVAPPPSVSMPSSTTSRA